MLWLSRPDGSLIFDESYYVNASRVIAGNTASLSRYQDAPLFKDPNAEHPPLAKLVVAASMTLLGDNPVAWRLPSVAAGMASIYLIYQLALALTRAPWVALVAAYLLAFDNLVFVHSRIFTLDIFELAFMLLGANLYLRGRYSLAGVALALGALSKIGGILALPALASFELMRQAHTDLAWRARLRVVGERLAPTAFFFALLFITLLGIMDMFWSRYEQPFEHLRYIVTYGQALRRNVPSGIESYPWQWLWNDVQIPYLRVEQQIKVGDEIRENRPLVVFLGAMNPFVLGLWPFALSFGLTWWLARGKRAELGAFSLAWFLWTYTPFYLTTILGQRIAYLFYFLPTQPAIALAGGGFLHGANLPRLAIWVYLAAVLLGFYGYFPFKPVGW
jgi:predicted membrane-bound dolichyl-phosphate-mannose-protein mannosyltransferase